MILYSVRGGGRHVCWWGMHGRGVCVVGSMHSRGTCVVGGVHGSMGVCGRGACMAGGVHGRTVCMAGGHTWQDRRPLQWTVHILLECILVYFEKLINIRSNLPNRNSWPQCSSSVVFQVAMF